ncbi:MAG TPA: YkgJ family cysteine cluster protein [Desulfobacteraceae bacterium]|nr:YkgJ family cysteine cluster protein [Deltaproteobacteria bacterium]MBW2356066.1 YkgJ family cysteine cluster protein [Deltaproteobacteria bacterium]RLB98952.1 MAG: hypothetical protein DRH76_01205 [Deltaproteobacteria bacterium]HDI59581.1 YkgJ family cysteine cluster protein [Desulfobacteraceae bacterium]
MATPASVVTLIDADLRRSFGARLHHLYADMDQAYRQVSAACGFICHGCDDNCCWSRFHHHTIVEYLDLQSGLASLTPNEREQISTRAVEAVKAPAQQRPPCPLLEDGRCRLYRHRPMICRLHGLPHRTERPDGTVLQGDGCPAFHARCGPARLRLDRTPFYRRMAALETQLRAEIGFSARVKLTVAEMIVAMGPEVDEP